MLANKPLGAGRHGPPWRLRLRVGRPLSAKPFDRQEDHLCRRLDVRFLSACRQFEDPIAYYDPRYRRDTAPLLDHLACVIDHVEAHSKGGTSAEGNLAVACNKCNIRKNSRDQQVFVSANPSRPVKGKYGEPRYWDGLASLFVVLSRENASRLTSSERVWLKELQAYAAGAREAVELPSGREARVARPPPLTAAFGVPRIN